MNIFVPACWPIPVRSFNFLTLLCMSLSAHAQIHLSPTESYTQEGAGEYCRTLGPSWRLMNITEIYALPQKTPFKEGYSYWSSSMTGSDNTEIGTGSEGDGGIIAMVGFSFYPKERNITLSPGWKRIAAACTDAGESSRLRHYRETAEGTLDPYSQLLWHPLDATDKRVKYTHDQAAEMCDNLTLYGRSWRLPTTDELYGIVDYAYTRPTVDMKFFGPMMHRYYWTNDSLNEKEAYVVGFKVGSVATAPKKESAYARCVSDSE